MAQSKVEKLALRLNEIAKVLELHPCALGLLGLGSAGDQQRMDNYSDLDFFAIVSVGYKSQFLNDLNWLSDIAPVAYAFRNTADGYKLLYEDGVFCEFAVFEPQELPGIPFEAGQFIWRDANLDEAFASPSKPLPAVSQDQDFLLVELLTNLYVGMCRFRRGEWCSAQRFVQVYALDRLITLLDMQLHEDALTERDPFCIDRRAEQRHPDLRQQLNLFLSGGEALPIGVAHMLDFVEQRYPVNMAMAAQIRALL